MVLKAARIAFVTALSVAFLLVWGGVAYAETSGYITAESSGSGYDAGFGARVESLHRFNFFALHGQINAALQHKAEANQGYAYGARSELRGYFERRIYISAGYGVSGYRSEFADGRVWSKRGWQPHIGAGFDTETFDLWGRYLLEEGDTVNRVSAATVGASWKPMPKSGWKMMCEFTRMSFDQAGTGMHETIGTFGIGWEF
jgi:hypothetical protein